MGTGAMTTRGAGTDVLVVGAGPTGLTAAVELARRDVSVRVVDRAPPRAPAESRALLTNARSQEVFERNGALRRMQDVGRPLTGLSFYARNRFVGRLNLTGLDGPHPTYLFIRQAETEQALLERLAELGVKVERPVTFVTARQDEGAVYATLAHPDGGSEEVTAAYLIAADGSRSGVRKSLGIEFPGDALQVREFLADFRIEWRGLEGAAEEDDARFFPGPPYSLAFGRFTGGVWRMIVNFLPGDPRWTPELPTLETLQALVDAHPDVDARLHDMTWVSSFGQSARKVEQLRHGRVFLAGDAAHIHSPFGAQGMNAGIADATNLAWKLALRLQGHADDQLLDSYHAERNPVLERLLALTSSPPTDRQMPQWGRSLLQPLAKPLRVAGIQTMARLDTLQAPMRQWASGYTVNYRTSSIVAQTPGVRAGRDWPRSRLARAARRLRRPGFDELLAGDRAPDAGGLLLAGRLGRLFEFWAGDTRHQLLLLPGRDADAGRAWGPVSRHVEVRYAGLVRALPVADGETDDGVTDDTIVDLNGELRRRYGTGRQLVLVRPDGYVGYRSGAPAAFEGLQSYLSRVLAA